MYEYNMKFVFDSLPKFKDELTNLNISFVYNHFIVTKYFFCIYTPSIIQSNLNVKKYKIRTTLVENFITSQSTNKLFGTDFTLQDLNLITSHECARI